jgi:hypothetical protein
MVFYYNKGNENVSFAAALGFEKNGCCGMK